MGVGCQGLAERILNSPSRQQTAESHRVSPCHGSGDAIRTAAAGPAPTEDRPLRFADMLRIALSALYQQKTRTLLTMLGVVLGTFILIVSVSLGRGVQQAVLREFSRHD